MLSRSHVLNHRTECIGSMLRQERHLRLHHLRIGESWANGWANSRAHGWDAGEKSGQRGTGNGRPFTPFGSEVSPCCSSLVSLSGQCQSRHPVWRAFLNMFSHLLLPEPILHTMYIQNNRGSKNSKFLAETAEITEATIINNLFSLGWRKKLYPARPIGID